MRKTITQRPLVANLFVSLDGYASGIPGAELRWLTTPFGDDVTRFALERLKAMDTLVLGRATYETLAGYWSAEDGPLAAAMNAIPKVVVSRTLASGDVTWPNTRVVAGDVAAEIGSLKHGTGRDVGLTGSVDLVRSLVKLGLVDRIELLVHPIVLGPDGGKRVFDGYDCCDFKLVDTIVLDGQVVVLDYQPIGGRPAWTR
jgi:dihydrofolate reductase